MTPEQGDRSETREGHEAAYAPGSIDSECQKFTETASETGDKQKARKEYEIEASR